MAYTTNLTTIVTKLRFRAFLWTSDLYKEGLMMDFNIFEFEDQTSINCEIVVKDLQGGVLDRAVHRNITINQQTIQMCGHLVNFFMEKFGHQVDISSLDLLDHKIILPIYLLQMSCQISVHL